MHLCRCKRQCMQDVMLSTLHYIMEISYGEISGRISVGSVQCCPKRFIGTMNIGVVIDNNPL